MQNGENIQALQKILDFMRFVSVSILLIHFYCVCHPAFSEWGITHPFADTLIFNFSKNLRFLSGVNPPKLASLLLLAVSVAGSKGKKSDTLTLAPILYYIIIGLMLFFISTLFLEIAMSDVQQAELYITITGTGYLSILAGGARLSRLLHLKTNKDIFNDLNETFPQQEEKLENEYSINLPAQYNLKGKIRRMWINVLNPFRALLVCGTPGSR